jgi:hypothetical protein
MRHAGADQLGAGRRNDRRKDAATKNHRRGHRQSFLKERGRSIPVPVVDLFPCRPPSASEQRRERRRGPGSARRVDREAAVGPGRRRRAAHAVQGGEGLRRRLRDLVECGDRVRAPAPVARLGDRPGRAVCHSFAARGGMECCDKRGGRGQSKRATAPCVLGVMTAATCTHHGRGSAHADTIVRAGGWTATARTW